MKNKLLRWVIDTYRVWEEYFLPEDSLVGTIKSRWFDIKHADYWVMWQGIKSSGLLLEPSSWPYVFRKDGDGYGECSSFTRVLCRLAGHPRGCWWQNAGGTEPDYHCKTCGDYTN